MNLRKRMLAVPFALTACLLHFFLSLLPLPTLLTVPIAACVPLALSRLVIDRTERTAALMPRLRLFLCILPVFLTASMLLSLLVGAETVLPDIPLALLFLYYVILPALFEELFYRHTLLPLLLPVSRTAAVFASALFFAAFHAPAAMPYAFVCGLLLAYAYLEGGILLPIALHFTNNALSFLLTCVDGMQVLYLPLLILCALACIPAVILFLKDGGYRRTKGKKQQ